MTTRGGTAGSTRRNTAVRGFTLIELLVSVAITALLVAIMLPGLAGVRESARRVSCASNQRQLGLTTHMYADSNNEVLPPAVVVNTSFTEDGQSYTPQFTPDGMPLTSLVLRFAGKDPVQTVGGRGWDGWGLVYDAGYLTAADVLYCPSHRAGVNLDAFRQQFEDAENNRVIGNYEYRGEGPNRLRRLSQIDSTSVFGSDAFGALGWLNHADGVNSLRIMLSVDWRARPPEIVERQTLATTSLVPDEEQDVEEQREQIRDIWRTLDGPAR